MNFLENEQLKVSISSKGAELKSIIHKQSNFEFLWQADANIWGRIAPILFPVVGKPFNNQLLVDGNLYEMPQHGFARDWHFEVIENTPSKIVFSLTSTTETLNIYPFHFDLRLSYTLTENTVECGYEVINCGTDKMFFSIGAHPGFNLPSKNLNDYFIEFEAEENDQRYLLTDGLLNGISETILLQSNKLELDKSLFDKDAAVLKNLKSKKIKLCSKTSHHKIEMTWNDFAYLGIWSKKDCEHFICLEPWCGIAGSVGEQIEIENKEGMNTILPNQKFERKYTMSFYI